MKTFLPARFVPCSSFSSSQTASRWRRDRRGITEEGRHSEEGAWSQTEVEGIPQRKWNKDKKRCRSLQWVLDYKCSHLQVHSHLTRLSYTELQPGRSHGSGAGHPEAAVSSGSERPFHTAADQPFTHTHDQGLKQRLTHTLVILKLLFQEELNN